MILSTGMADMHEIHHAVQVVKTTWARIGYNPSINPLTVLHCTSNYPAAFSDVNLNAMQAIGREIGSNRLFGSHFGHRSVDRCRRIGGHRDQKHFTIDNAMPGPDHAASLNPDELKALVDSVRAVEQCLGTSTKAPTATELPIRALVRRSVTLVRDIEAGATLQATDLALLRPGTGISPAELDRVSRCQTKKAMKAGTTLNWSDLV